MHTLIIGYVIHVMPPGLVAQVVAILMSVLGLSQIITIKEIKANNAHHRIVAALLPVCLRLHSSFYKLSLVVAGNSAVNPSLVHAASLVNHKVNLLQV